MNIARNFLDWFAELTAPKTEYGITEKQQEELLWHARRGEHGRDTAEVLATQVFGMDILKFYQLLSSQGIDTK